MHVSKLTVLGTRKNKGKVQWGNSIAVRVLRLGSSKRQPVQLPNPSSFFLHFDLIPCQFLLLLRNLGGLRISLCTTSGGSGIRRRHRGLSPRPDGRVRAAPPRKFRVSERIINDCSFTLVRHSPILNIPYFWTYMQSYGELLITSTTTSRLTQG